MRFALIAMHAQENAITALGERLRVPQECRELAQLVARYHADIGKALALPAASLLWLLQAADALRRPQRFAQLLELCAVAAANPATIELYLTTLDRSIPHPQPLSRKARGASSEIELPPDFITINCRA